MDEEIISAEAEMVVQIECEPVDVRETQSSMINELH
jgi:hypothetical protein